MEAETIKLLTEKVTAEAKLAAAREALESKDKEIARLQEQVEKLQDALVSTTSPKAYDDRRADIATVPVDQEQTKKRRREAEINAELLARMEQPTFKDADDMIAMLTGSVDFGKSESVHGNSES